MERSYGIPSNYFQNRHILFAHPRDLYYEGLVVQVNFCQKYLFTCQLTHNMTADCTMNYKFSTRKLQEHMSRTCCLHKLFWMYKQRIWAQIDAEIRFFDEKHVFWWVFNKILMDIHFFYDICFYMYLQWFFQNLEFSRIL